ncbi:TetR/AcrR family transcriptional regulator [Mycolicibacterium komossense]|uniref:TetR/AcrR family transcriptional regulator C-terminal ligand-binding domain-containing protein n=1 Tax=Mycolicibacterium komossense TaxID=1779 RepID=A0ABT3C4U4_9MYCO|nr:TetR/AcrR family transcriptional regulator [Mycolicibacterium komossense]MCV7224492.1 TetR/AcrR family transcriptional regulator C-terminal ligand-binding domain-containing protein [Mycolicibacterium komossense]
MTSSARPGGRTAAVRDAVLSATADLLVEAGLGGIELTAVADRAGVGKSTVYRRWRTVPALVADLLVDMAETSLPRANTGTLRGDLLANAVLVRRTLSDRRQGRLFKAIIAAAACDPQTAQALAGFYTARLAEFAPIVTEGIARGEAPRGTDAAEVIRYISAPLYYQFLTTTRSLTVSDAERAVDAAMAAVTAGVFVRS